MVLQITSRNHVKSRLPSGFYAVFNFVQIVQWNTSDQRGAPYRLLSKRVVNFILIHPSQLLPTGTYARHLRQQVVFAYQHGAQQ